jgi:hypothetical protein
MDSSIPLLKPFKGYKFIDLYTQFEIIFPDLSSQARRRKEDWFKGK